MDRFYYYPSLSIPASTNLDNLVANRVAEIQEILYDPIGITSLQQTTLLIALHMEQLELLQSSSLWWKGPRWLQQQEDLWQKTKLQQVESFEVRGQNSKRTPQSLSLAVTQSTLLFRHDQYSSFSNLISVAATVLIAVDKFKGSNRSSVINTKDLASAKWKIFQ